MYGKKFTRTAALAAALCLLLAGGVLAAVLGELINGHETYLGAGMELSKGVYWTGSDYQTENYIALDRNAPAYPVVVSGSKVCNYGSFSSMAALLEKQGKHVIAGINGDYFVLASYEPLGIIVQDGELWSSDAGHWAIGFKSDGSAIFGKPALSVRVSIGGQDFSLDGVNKTRADGGAMLYTDDYSGATKNKGGGTDLICALSAPLGMNGAYTLTVEALVTAGGAAAIPAGKAVLSVSDNATDGLKTAVAALTAGSTMRLAISSPPDWAGVTYAIGSLYKLVTNGTVESGLPAGTAPRSAVGLKADGTLIFYTVDGRQSGYSQGVTITQLAERMRELGCVEAAIMDGGGSTSLNAIYLGDSSVSQINNPSDGYQRSVTNYIMLVTDAGPIGTATRLALYPLSTTMLSGATAAFTLKAADDNGYAAALNKPVSLSVDSALGAIGPDGIFTAGGAGSGHVTASAEGLVPAAVQVNVVATPDSITVKNENGKAGVTALSVLTGSTTALTAEAMKNHVPLISRDSCFTWTAEGGIGTVTADGTFTAGAETAGGTLTVSAGNKSVSIPVTVTSPERFDDVRKGDWFYDAVKYVSDAGVMTGTADRLFSPDADMSRAMVVTVLWRKQGSPEPAGGGSFSDVPGGQWYSKAVYWANESGVVQGYGGSFDPFAAVTREQLAAILYRYSGSPAAGSSLGAFTDAASVSGWAVSAVNWAVEKKLINGVTDTRLLPGATATRAQVAMIFSRMQ
ncbi:MAG: phosphodiester glycosidase family protein [Oscillospiraceae bacterium]|jgi:hypothetical protein|nr:phosphodiester glycosidase family protein [Oscillospiraceae bacterium]